MSPAWIARTLRTHGVSLRVHTGKLVIDAPFGVLKPYDHGILDQEKHRLARYLEVHPELKSVPEAAAAAVSARTHGAR
jgi:hypothetical protein